MIPPGGGGWLLSPMDWPLQGDVWLSDGLVLPLPLLYLGQRDSAQPEDFTCCILSALKPKFHFSSCAKNNVLVFHRILPPDNSMQMSVRVDYIFNISHTVDFLSNKAVLKASTSGSVL